MVVHEFEYSWPTDTGPLGVLHVIDRRRYMVKPFQDAYCICGLDASIAYKPTNPPDAVGVPEGEAVLPAMVNDSPYKLPVGCHALGGVPPLSVHCTGGIAFPTSAFVIAITLQIIARFCGAVAELIVP